MGIKHFFSWFSKQFPDHIHKLRKNKTFRHVNVNIDHLGLDMNGILHDATQRVYEYGNYKRPKRLLVHHTRDNPTQTLHKQLQVFKHICSTVDNIFNVVKPSKTLILCIDGVAPVSKQNQQRQRRFRSAMESSGHATFDSNCITPGTEFMHHLSTYIDWYIRRKITSDAAWKKVKVVFSDATVPGEGEHKLINYIRRYGRDSDTYCIHGLDADLIMLTLGTHMPNFYLLRDDLYDPKNEYFCIDIGKVRVDLVDILRWSCDTHTFVPKQAVNDFIFLCFMVGNDFLPHIPSIEIIEDGVELILRIYRSVCSSYGHITEYVDDDVRFIPETLGTYLATIGYHEKENFERKLHGKRSFFPDELVNKHAVKTHNGWDMDIEGYKRAYMDDKFEGHDEERVCHSYFHGMQWVISYYTKGVPDWEWYFAHHYAPPASVLSLHAKTFTYTPSLNTTRGYDPFRQLLSVLPPKSADLLPNPLNKLLSDETSEMRQFCPADIVIDLAGKRREWEGIVLLPVVDASIVKKLYNATLPAVQERDLARNATGKSFMYEHSEFTYSFKSYYGDIRKCSAFQRSIIF